MARLPLNSSSELKMNRYAVHDRKVNRMLVNTFDGQTKCEIWVWPLPLWSNAYRHLGAYSPTYIQQREQFFAICLNIQNAFYSRDEFVKQADSSYGYTNVY